MFYRLLGMLVWNGGKVLLRQKYGRTYFPKPVLAGVAVLALIGGVVLLVTRQSGDD